MPDRVWLDNRHVEYTANEHKWVYAQDHYTGDLLDKMEEYLIQRAMGEELEAFNERVYTSDYTPLLPAVVNSLAGQLFEAEVKTTRSFGQLGDPTDLQTPAGRLWRDADGKGDGWLTIWRKAVIDLIVSRKIWCLVDVDEFKNTQVHILNPRDVVNWRMQGGRPVEVVLRESVDLRESVRDNTSPEYQYIVYTLGGLQRFRRVQGAEDGSGATVSELTGLIEYSYQDPSGRPVLPIFPIELPLNRDVGYQLARKANAIFNKGSMRDWLLRVSNSPYLVLSAAEDAFEETTAKLRKGARVIQEDMRNLSGPGTRFIAPSSEPARVSMEELKRAVEEFYVSAFRAYNDSAIERTATEIRQEVSAGAGAFLALLKASIDDAENHAWFLIEQQQFSQDQSAWYQARVERSDDFQPLDAASEAERLTTQYFGQGKAVPMSVDGLVKVIKKINNLNSVVQTDQEVRSAALEHKVRDVINMMSSLPVPPPIKAEITRRIFEPIFTPEELNNYAPVLEQAAEDAAAREAQGGGVGLF